MDRVGIIGDNHLPFAHPKYLEFCQDTFEAWNVNRVVFIGDVFDLHSIGFWDTDPNGHSAKDEVDLGRAALKPWKEAFPEALVCIGNHDCRPQRVASKYGLPTAFMRDFADVWETPNWNWDWKHRVDGVLYEHGTGSSGKDAAFNRATQNRVSTVIGHTHCYGGVKWSSSHYDRIFGLNVGCGIDCQAYAFAYGKDFATRPTLGCGIVINGKHPYFEIMPCGEGEPYHRNA